MAKHIDDLPNELLAQCVILEHVGLCNAQVARLSRAWRGRFQEATSACTRHVRTATELRDAVAVGVHGGVVVLHTSVALFVDLDVMVSCELRFQPKATLLLYRGARVRWMAASGKISGARLRRDLPSRHDVFPAAALCVSGRSHLHLHRSSITYGAGAVCSSGIYQAPGSIVEAVETTVRDTPGACVSVCGALFEATDSWFMFPKAGAALAARGGRIETWNCMILARGLARARATSGAVIRANHGPEVTLRQF